MDLSTRQLAALARIVTACEAICESGLLPEVSEFELRKRIAETLTVFGLPHHQETAA